MPKDMAGDASGDRDASVLKRLPHDPPDRAGSQRMKRWPALQKGLAKVTPRSPALYVGYDGLTDVGRQGQASRSEGFPGLKAYLTMSPIDIVQAQRDHVLRTEAKTHELQEYGAIAETAGGTVLVRGQHTLDFCSRRAWREHGLPRA
jgi:hypothetical protein